MEMTFDLEQSTGEEKSVKGDSDIQRSRSKLLDLYRIPKGEIPEKTQEISFSNNCKHALPTFG